MPNLRLLNPSSIEDIHNLIKEGSRRRTKDAVRSISNKSHTILQAVIGHRDKATGINAQILKSKLTLIDLAGS